MNKDNNCPVCQGKLEFSYNTSNYDCFRCTDCNKTICIRKEILCNEEMLRKNNLECRLWEFGAQPEELVVDWAKRICCILMKYHSENPPFIYEELKPSNIIIDTNGNVLLNDVIVKGCDYKELFEFGPLAFSTLSGYYSPEQITGNKVDQRTDIFCLGMTIKHLLTNIDPVRDEITRYNIREINPNVSKKLARIVDKCIELNPDNRYQTVDELYNDLDNYKNSIKNKILMHFNKKC